MTQVAFLTGISPDLKAANPFESAQYTGFVFFGGQTSGRPFSSAFKSLFSLNFPEKAKTVIPIACTSSHSAQNIAFNELGRQAIAADSKWNEGDYNIKDTIPNKGLAVARMAAHITYLSKRRGTIIVFLLLRQPKKTAGAQILH